MNKVTPFLMFDNNAEEAMKFYVSIFKNSKIIDNGTFEIEGQQFLVFNGGPYFKFSEGISLFINCDTQLEVDDLWVMDAMLKMNKIIIKDLEKAYNQK